MDDPEAAMDTLKSIGSSRRYEGTEQGRRKSTPYQSARFLIPLEAPGEGSKVCAVRGLALTTPEAA